MPRPDCSSCADSGICIACHGKGKRVRIYGLLLLYRREIVTCKACRGSGDCPLCWDALPEQEREAQPRPRRGGLRSVSGNHP